MSTALNPNLANLIASHKLKIGSSPTKINIMDLTLNRNMSVYDHTTSGIFVNMAA